MKSSQKVLVAGLVGAATGAVAGLLLAPAEGKKTRKKIAKSVDEMKTEVESFVDKSKEKIEEFSKNGKQTEKAAA